MTTMHRQPFITEPGTYDLTDDEYHGDMVVGGSLSSTGARELLRPGGPARFHYHRTHPRADKPHFDLGRAVHTIVLGVGAPVVSVPVKNRSAKGWKEAEAKARAAGETPLPEHEADQAYAMAEALRAHPVVGKLLGRPGRAEQSFVGRDPESGVMCRTRVDWMPDVPAGAHPIGVDVKTSQDAAPDAFAKSMGSYGYHQQGPFYEDVLRWLGIAPAGWHFVLAVVEKEPPHLVSYGSPDAAAIQWGRVLNRKARDIYRECTTTGVWPGYSLEPAALSLPSWMTRQYEAAFDDGAYDIAADRAANLIGETA